ncbi:MAG: sugar ABC transporter permease [Spirochaetales bacterium]
MATSRKSLETERNLAWLVWILPALLVYLVFMAWPLLNSLRLSFYTGSGFQLDNFIGFDNYRRLFGGGEESNRFYGAFGNTFIFFAIHMLVQNSLGLAFALLLSRKDLKGRALFRTIIFIPATLAIIVTGFLWKLLLNPQWGPLNLILGQVGLGDWALPWLGEHNLALPVISLVSSWQWVGIPTMIFLAALNGISEDYFEAAQIDGATGWQVLGRIKLPLLLPIMSVVAILTFTGNFNAFDVVFAMAGPNGPPGYATDILGTYFYRTGIAGQHPVGIPDMGLGAAVSSVTFVVLLVGVLSMQYLGRDRDAEAQKKAAQK